MDMRANPDGTCPDRRRKARPRQGVRKTALAGRRRQPALAPALHAAAPVGEWRGPEGAPKPSGRPASFAPARLPAAPATVVEALTLWTKKLEKL